MVASWNQYDIPLVCLPFRCISVLYSLYHSYFLVCFNVKLKPVQCKKMWAYTRAVQLRRLLGIGPTNKLLDKSSHLHITRTTQQRWISKVQGSQMYSKRGQKSTHMSAVILSKRSGIDPDNRLLETSKVLPEAIWNCHHQPDVTATSYSCNLNITKLRLNIHTEEQCRCLCYLGGSLATSP